MHGKKGDIKGVIVDNRSVRLLLMPWSSRRSPAQSVAARMRQHRGEEGREERDGPKKLARSAGFPAHGLLDFGVWIFRSARKYYYPQGFETHTSWE